MKISAQVGPARPAARLVIIAACVATAVTIAAAKMTAIVALVVQGCWIDSRRAVAIYPGP